MKTLWIVGAGGFGREVLGFARDAVAAGKTDFLIGGFIDDHAASLDNFDVGVSVRCAVENLAPGADDVFCIALGSPAGRLAIAERLDAKGAAYASVIHPSAVISERAVLGSGCVVGPGAFVSVDAKVGLHVAIGFNAAVGHDAIVGAGSVITGCCIVNGGASLGRGVFLGSHSVVLPRVEVGDGVASNAGSIIMRSAPAGAKVGGNPARQLPQLAV
ncbi:acetyltransferase [Brevundimonas kwangchunensis]|uniref:Acetyltransferase n=1 Tax=Brevundimonas kwangchunensis TaxID=322163 RepID=A0ABN1GGK3_9CAUL